MASVATCRQWTHRFGFNIMLMASVSFRLQGKAIIYEEGNYLGARISSFFFKTSLDAVYSIKCLSMNQVESLLDKTFLQ